MLTPTMKQQVLDFFHSPSVWTKNALARDKDGNGVHCDDPNAVCWCVIGAVFKLFPNLRPYFSGHDVHDTLQRLAGGRDYWLVHHWNNDPNLTFEEFKQTLAAAETTEEPK